MKPGLPPWPRPEKQPSRPWLGATTGTVAIIALGLVAMSSGGEAWGRVEVTPGLEDLHPDGSRYTPSTQSFLRGTHSLDDVSAARVELDTPVTGRLRLEHPEIDFEVVGLPFDQLVPRMHYAPAEPADAFDAFNLLLAEYSRNGMSVPTGEAGDTMAHFESSLVEERPYHLEGDYEFVANPKFRPVRFSVVNNCLAPGLWELSAEDRSGEIYHSWMNVPDEEYYDLVAQVNNLPLQFVRDALTWRTDEVPIDLDRLRRTVVDLGRVNAALHEDASTGYSSQDSRRKLAAGYALVDSGEGRRRPANLDDLTRHEVQMSEFIAPGKYSIDQRRRFDFGFLRRLQAADITRSKALTNYDWRNAPREDQPDCIEIHLDLGDWVLVLGNLPINLLVHQEDLGIWGFGVGVLRSSDYAERRKFLIEQGPPPSFAYLCRRVDGRLIAVNSHDYGLEQVFVRTHSQSDDPWWEITVASYERIADIVKYRVEIPGSLVEELKNIAANYTAPLFRTYRDDNLR